MLNPRNFVSFSCSSTKFWTVSLVYFLFFELKRLIMWLSIFHKKNSFFHPLTYPTIRSKSECMTLFKLISWWFCFGFINVRQLHMCTANNNIYSYNSLCKIHEHLKCQTRGWTMASKEKNCRDSIIQKIRPLGMNNIGITCLSM